MPSPIQPGWFSIPGAAKYTGFSVTTIRTAIKLGRFPFHQVPVSGQKSIRIKREHLDAWIEGRPIE
ncbi:MAG TPA: helix-turn-helix domain-containing protein [Luteolibacter sp.]